MKLHSLVISLPFTIIMGASMYGDVSPRRVSDISPNGVPGIKSHLSHIEARNADAAPYTWGVTIKSLYCADSTDCYFSVYIQGKPHDGAPGFAKYCDADSDDQNYVVCGVGGQKWEPGYFWEFADGPYTDIIMYFRYKSKDKAFSSKTRIPAYPKEQLENYPQGVHTGFFKAVPTRVKGQPCACAPDF